MVFCFATLAKSEGVFFMQKNGILLIACKGSF